MKLSILCILAVSLLTVTAHPSPVRRKCHSKAGGSHVLPPTEPVNLGYGSPSSVNGHSTVPTPTTVTVDVGQAVLPYGHGKNNEHGPTYGINPNYKPNRSSYPWEDQLHPGVQPGYQPDTNLPLYGKRPRVPLPATDPINNNNTKNDAFSANAAWIVGAPYTGAPNQPYVPGFVGQELIRKPLPMDSKPFNMTLIHTNDLHARFAQFSRSGIDCTVSDIANKTCYGGIARIKTITDKIRATEPNVCMLDAGDQFQGTMFSSFYKGNVTLEFMNLIGYDAFSIGNHEFDDGPAHLAKFIRKLHVPALSSNIDSAAEPAMFGLVAPKHKKLFSSGVSRSMP